VSHCTYGFLFSDRQFYQDEMTPNNKPFHNGVVFTCSRAFTLCAHGDSSCKSCDSQNFFPQFSSFIFRLTSEIYRNWFTDFLTQHSHAECAIGTLACSGFTQPKWISVAKSAKLLKSIFRFWSRSATESTRTEFRDRRGLITALR